MQHIVGRAWARQCDGRIRLLPPEINWAHRMLSQSTASSLLRWLCTHWPKRVASVLSNVPLSVAKLRTESWALIRVLWSARLRHVSLTWLLSPLLVRATNDHPAVMFQPSDSYTCCAIPLEHRLHVSSQLGPSGQWLWQWVGPTALRRGNAHAAYKILNEILIAILEVTVIYIYININISCWSHKSGVCSRSPN